MAAWLPDGSRRGDGAVAEILGEGLYGGGVVARHAAIAAGISRSWSCSRRFWSAAAGEVGADAVRQYILTQS